MILGAYCQRIIPLLFMGMSMHINLQAVEEQFADTDYDLTVRRKVQFQSTARDADPAIEMKFERNLPNGWSVTRESDDKVVY